MTDQQSPFQLPGDNLNRLSSTRRQFLATAAIFGAAGSLGLAACSAPPNASGDGSGSAGAGGAAGTREVAPGVPRNQCLILENPT